LTKITEGKILGDKATYNLYGVRTCGNCPLPSSVGEIKCTGARNGFAVVTTPDIFGRASNAVKPLIELGVECFPEP